MAVYSKVAPMHYVAKVTRSGKAWRFDFPDIPRLSSTTGSSLDEAAATAKEALTRWMRQHLVQGSAQAPARRYAGPGHTIELPGDVALAIELRDARCNAAFSRPELAQRAGVPQRLIEDLEAALTVALLGKVVPIAKALGMRPVIELDRPAEAVGLTRGRPSGPSRRSSG